MRAVQITRFGGPEVLELVELPDPEPAEGRVLVDVEAAGVNYADTHQTENSYLSRQHLPFVPGASVVGRDPEGRRVLALTTTGGYAERVLAPTTAVFPLPDAVGDAAALGMSIQGSTAWHVLRTSAHLAPGETVVVHAAAGGVGSVAVQLARRWGAGRVLATASTEEKRALAVELGAHEALDAESPGLSLRLRKANGGRPVDVVLEMTGGTVFDESLRALAPFGRLVAYGMASRTPPTPVRPAELMARSQAVLGFWLVHCFTRPPMMAQAYADLFAMLADGSLRVVDGGHYPLSKVRRAHEDIRARRTVGAVVLDVRR